MIRLLLEFLVTKVAGFTHGGVLRPGHGAYSQYARIDGKNFFRIPEGISFDEAATYSTSYQTASHGLYNILKLPEPYAKPDAAGTAILVWGGACEFFSMALQILNFTKPVVESFGWPVCDPAR